jgi:hypothetical protein
MKTPDTIQRPRRTLSTALPGRPCGTCSGCDEYRDKLHVLQERPLRALCPRCCPCGKEAA